MKKNSSSVVLTPEMIALRLDKALSLLPEVATRSRAAYLIEKNLVFINGRPAKASHKVAASDEILMELPAVQSSDLLPVKMPLDIFFEDDDLIVINKPSGLVVHPAAGHAQDTLVNGLLYHCKNLSMKFGEDRPGIVHRLDRDTSGLLVAAKNDFTHEALAQQFKEKTAHRIYFAVTEGRPQSKGTIQSYLLRHPSDRKKYASVRGSDQKIIRKKTAGTLGKWSVTHFDLLASFDRLSLLKLKLETGRTHQIRVHLSEMAWPIVADPIYGRTKSEFAFPRLALHAAELGFVHPRTKQSMHFRAHWPGAEAAILKPLFGDSI